MPTKYKPILNHVGLDYEVELDAIAVRVEVCWQAIREAFIKCGKHLESDDKERIVTDIVTILTRFVLNCDALPVRTSNMMIATASEIAKNPQKFLDLSERFDPEVNAMILDAAARFSAATNASVQKFELGEGNGPPSEDIAKAASNVIQFLQRRTGTKAKVGRPYLGLQTDLAVALGRVFRNHGGKITRTTHDGESGPFHEFLEVLLPAVRPFAQKAGFDLNVMTMVVKAQRVLGA